MSHGVHNQGDMSMPAGSMSNDDMNMTMHMTLYWGKYAVVLFSGWPKDNLGMYILALLVVLVLGILVEVVSVSRTAKRGTNNPILSAFNQACVYTVHMAFAYMVMLAVMSFNVGILIAAVLGHAIGFFITKARALAIADGQCQNDTFPKP